MDKSVVYPLFTWGFSVFTIFIYWQEGFSDTIQYLSIASLLFIIKSALWYKKHGGIKEFLLDSVGIVLGGTFIYLIVKLIIWIF